MAREPQLAQINQRLIDGTINPYSYFREIGPFLGLSLVILEDKIYLFSDPVTYEVFKGSDQWQKDLTKKGMPFAVTGQTGLQVVTLIAKLVSSENSSLPEEISVSVDITHTTGVHISRLKSAVFSSLQRSLDLERTLVSDKIPNPELSRAMISHQHLHVATKQKNGVEMLAYFRLLNGQHVIPVFTGPDLAFGALGPSGLGLFDISGVEFFKLVQNNHEVRTETAGILFNPYSNTEKFVPWQNLGHINLNLGDLGQSA